MNDFPFPPSGQMSNQRCLKKFESLMEERLSQVTKMLFLICLCDNDIYLE